MSLYDAIPEELQDFRIRSCVIKIRYATEEEAIRGLVYLRSKGEKKPLHVYFCHYCQNWHIGGCTPEEEGKAILLFENKPFVFDSIKKSWSDTKRHCRVLTGKGYHIRTISKNRKHRKIYEIYTFKPEATA